MDACYWLRRKKLGLSAFRGVIQSLIQRSKLNRVVVDEAHIAVLSAELPRMHGAAEERV